jgi:hypothetical protein
MEVALAQSAAAQLVSAVQMLQAAVVAVDQKRVGGWGREGLLTEKNRKKILR